MELTQCINYLLTTAQHRVFQELSSRLEAYDVTPIQYGVLYCLWENGPSKPKEISRELKIENSTISGILDRMEKKGLITREISKKDRRFIEVKLTEKGRSIEKPVLKIVEEVNKDVLSVIPVDKCESLREYLKLISEYENK